MITNTILLEKYESGNALDCFEEHEILEYLLSMAGCKFDIKILSDRLLNEFGSLKGVLEAREEQLVNINGIGKRASSMILMIKSFARIWQRLNLPCPKKISNSWEAEQYCKSLLTGLRNEQFYVICMNAKCGVIGQRKISDGSLSEVNSYPRIVVETALNYNAHSILLCHNHPGGTNSPSTEDINSTIILQKTLNAIGIMVLDHIIVCGNNAYSMIQHGDIDYRIKR